MIQYSLKCDEGHQFDSWFQSAAAFDSLRKAGHLSCAVCGCAAVDKALMAPRVSTDQAEDPRRTPLTGAPDPAELALARLRKHVEANSDYVGGGFVREARAMHLGDAPERAIWGEARPEEARALLEDGIPVAPLPFMPTRKAN